MPQAKVEKGRRKTELPPWPLDAEGKPVKPLHLETILSANQINYDLHTNLLHANGIPTLRSFPRDGSLGQIILGFSGAGLDIYVPETMLEAARKVLEIEEAPL